MSTPNSPTTGPASPTSAAGPDGTPPVPQRPQFGTIVWGAILVVLAGWVGAGTLPGIGLSSTVLGVGALVVLGVLLVAAGVAATVRSARHG